jgi:hypothetical protein
MDVHNPLHIALKRIRGNIKERQVEADQDGEQGEYS